MLYAPGRCAVMVHMGKGNDVNYPCTEKRQRNLTMENKMIDELSKRLGEILPPGINTLKEDMEKNIRSVLHSAFSKMDLVTREEFEVQAKVLQRSREKLATLEKQLAELEAKLKHSK
jgi:BMFP domain-containing protein YqiC